MNSISPTIILGNTNTQITFNGTNLQQGDVVNFVSQGSACTETGAATLNNEYKATFTLSQGLWFEQQ